MSQIRFTAESRKSFEKLRDRKLQSRITQALQKLSQSPFSGKKLQGRLKDTYSLRVWPYRILYEFDKEKDIIITDIRHRKDVYG